MKENSCKLAIYALHPIMYQTPIFAKLESESKNLNLESTVLFGDDLSLREVFYEEINTVFKPDTPFLLDGYRYKFLRNYAGDSRAGFFSRVNLGVFAELVCGRYDAILLHGFDRFSSFLIILAAKLTQTKLIWRGENIIKEKHRRTGFKGRLKYFFIKFLFKLFDGVMYSCTGNKKYLEYYAVPPQKLFPIPCAVNNQFFQEQKALFAQDRDEIRAELGISKDDFVLIFPARFTERKRPYDLIKSVAKLNDLRSNIVLLFVGDGPEKEKMEAEVRTHDLRAIFTGFMNQSTISKFYVAADIGIVISREDPSPKAMNEMMNFELPIIVTDVVGTALDLVMTGINGFVIDVGDIAALSEKIEYLRFNKDVADAMGKASLDIVNKWNYEEDVKGIIRAFENVTAKKVKRG